MYSGNSKEQKKQERKIEKLKPLLDMDFCACGTLYAMKCKGDCRKAHEDKRGRVSCGELYRVDPNLVKQKKRKRKPAPDPVEKDGKEKRRRREKGGGHLKD